MDDSNTPSQERDGQAGASQSDTADETVASGESPDRESADTVDAHESTDAVDAALAEADAALTRAADAHDDYREAITDATLALDEVDGLRGRETPGRSSSGHDRSNSDRPVDTDGLGSAAAPEYTDGTGHLELSHAGQVLVRSARTLKRSRAFPQERAAGLVQTTARASIHLCHEDVPSDALVDVATEAIEGVGDLTRLCRDDDATEEQVAEAATELFEILSKVEEVRAASEARHVIDE